MDLKDRVIVVTGGASGLGQATVERFVKGGAKAVIVDLNEERGKKLEAEMGGNAAFFKCDVSDDAQVEACIEFAMKKFGRIDIMHNNAAMGLAAKIADCKKGKMHDMEGFIKVLYVNTVAAFNFSRRAAIEMYKNEPNADGERGLIVNTTTVASFEGQIGQVAYAASKGAINSMTIVMARDLSGDGIRCMTIAPGMFDTPVLGQLDPKVKEALGKMIPFPPRLGHADEFARLVQQIAENPMLNGEVIRLDGAIRMQPR